MEYIYKRKINYYETDLMGVVHHSNYLRYLEEARCEWLEKNNMSFFQLEEEGITAPVLEANIKYMRPLRYGDEVEIFVKLVKFDGCRFTFNYAIKNLSTSKEVFCGETQHCFTNKSLRPVNLKKKDTILYGKLLCLLS